MYDFMSCWWGIDIQNSPSYKDVTKFQNIRSAVNTFARYCNIASHRFEFEGCPETISERVLREGLLWYPCISFWTVGDSTVAMPSVPGGSGFNAYGDLGDGFAYAKNGKVYKINYDIPGGDTVRILNETVGPRVSAEYSGRYIRANDLMFPFINTVIFYTEQVADTLRAIENARILLKHPIGLYTTEAQKKNWEKWYNELKENQPIMFINKNKPADGHEPDKAEVVNLVEGGDIIKPASEVLDWFENRFLAECGVGNIGSQVDKKGENLISDEVHGSDAVTNMVTEGLVEYINNELEKQGIREMPGCENLKCVPRKDIQDENIQRDDRGGEGNISGSAGYSDETDDI